jgi:hypothetical protein
VTPYISINTLEWVASYIHFSSWWTQVLLTSLTPK